MPRTLREPTRTFHPWLVPLVGIGVLLLVLLFVAIVPWESWGSAVGHADLPHTQFIEAWDGDPQATLWIWADEKGRFRIGSEWVDLAAVIRSVEAYRDGSVVLAFHRDLRWSTLRSILEPAAAAELPTLLYVTHEGRRPAYLALNTRPSLSHVKKIRTGLVSDPVAAHRGTRDYYREQERSDTYRPLVIEFAPEGDPDLQAVVSTLECYAKDNAVALAGFDS